jgi:hypothetical protein
MSKMSKDRWLIMTVIAMYILMIAVNALANILPIGGMTSGEVSDAYPNLFAPIGYTFSIWSVIYTLLLGFTLYLAVKHWRNGFDGKMYLHRVTVLFIVSSVFNISWMFAWHYQVIWLSLMLMMGILYTLIRINLILRDRLLLPQEAALVRLPFNIYFGWITVATIANITVLLVDLKWNRFGIPEEALTVAVLVAGAFIALLAIRGYGNLAFGAVVLWAYGGILAKHLSPIYFNGQYPLIINALYMLLVIIGIFELAGLAKHIKVHKQGMNHLG